MGFNEGRFVELLKKAQGDRTLNEYARNTGVSSSYISRIIKGNRPMPLPKIIKKLATNTQNGVTYLDLMKAAGYL